MSFIVPDTLPRGWSVVKLGQLFRERNERVSDEDFPPLSVTMDGIVPQLDHVALTDHNDNRKLVRAGDIVINSRSDRKGAAGRAPLDGSVSLISTVLEPTLGNGHFFHHLIRSKPFQEEFYRHGKGIHSDLWTTRYDQMKRIEVAVPPEATQRAIASFLDGETARIDALIEKKWRLLDLLEEKRTALITRAVTRGLDPDVPMKDSGVEWIGKIPQHWEVVKLRHICQSAIAGPFGSSLTKSIYGGDTYRVYGQQQVIPNDFSRGDYYIPTEVFQKLKRFETKPDDVLISCMGTVGKAAVVPRDVEPGIINPRLVRLRLRKSSIIPDYVPLALRSPPVLYHIESMSRGGTMGGLNLNIVSQILLPLPPIAEQRMVLSHVQRQELELDRLLDKVARVVKLLKEYRTSLISAAVTGKTDVTSGQHISAIETAI